MMSHMFGGNPEMVALMATNPWKVRLSTDRTTTGTGNTDATGLSFAVTGGVTYVFNFSIRFQVSALLTAGIGIGVNGPTPTAGEPLVMQTRINTGLLNAVLGNVRALDTLVSAIGIDAINTDTMASIDGMFRPNADGTLVVRFARTGTAATVRIMAGSSGLLWATG